MIAEGEAEALAAALRPSATLSALGAIALWSTLAALALRLAAVPALLLTGLALLIGSLAGARALTRRPPPLAALALGVSGLFGFPFFLFLALRRAPPVQANLVNYLWPLLIVVLAPLAIPGLAWSARHALAALLGFAGGGAPHHRGRRPLGCGARLGLRFCRRLGAHLVHLFALHAPLGAFSERVVVVLPRFGPRLARLSLPL